MVKQASWNGVAPWGPYQAPHEYSFNGPQGGRREYEDDGGYGGGMNPMMMMALMQMMNRGQGQQPAAQTPADPNGPITQAELQASKDRRAQHKANPQAPEKAPPEMFSGENLRNVAQGQGSGTGGRWFDKDFSYDLGGGNLNPLNWGGDLANIANSQDAPLSIAAGALPGNMVRGMPGFVAGTAKDIQEGNYGQAAKGLGIQTALSMATANANRVPGAAQALGWGGRIGQAGKDLAAPVVEGGKALWNAGRALGGGEALQTLTKATPAAGVAAKVLNPLGLAASVGTNVAGAVTGDQNYLSDGFWGQMGEQAFRTGGDLVAGAKMGPWGLATAGAGALANVGANAYRAFDALGEARQSARDAETIQDRIRNNPVHQARVAKQQAEKAKRQPVAPSQSPGNTAPPVKPGTPEQQPSGPQSATVQPGQAPASPNAGIPKPPLPQTSNSGGPAAPQ